MRYGGQFLEGVNLYAAVNAERWQEATWENSRTPSPEEAKLKFSVLGGKAFEEAKTWYEWIRDSLFSSCLKSDLLWDFSVDENGIRCKCRQRRMDGRYNSEPLNYEIDWYYNDTGMQVKTPDMHEFLTRCGLKCSLMPDFRADMIEDYR